MLHPRGPSGYTIHTVDGRQVGTLPEQAVLSALWSRELTEVSRCEITFADEVAARLVPWHHWITAWDGEHPVWTGPIQQAVIGRSTARLSARDVSTFMWRTRTPLTKRWAGTEVSAVAAEMWIAMLALHRVDATPVVRRNLVDRAFDVSATADSTMLNAFLDELTKIGLQWTVVAGRPLLGTLPSAPIATLGEDDIIADIEVIRDGTNTYNDVRLQGQNFAARALSDLGGLRLQTLVSIDTMFGVSNVQRATDAYAAQVSQIRDTLVIPSGAGLRLDQTFGIDDMIPGVVFAVYARDLSTLMRLDKVEVSRTPGTYAVAVTMTAIEQRTDLGGRA